VGRVDTSDPKAPTFAWTMSGLTAIVSGPTITAKLRTEGTEKVFVQPLIDGKVSRRFEVASGSDREIVLATGLGPGDHVVELYRETEGAYGTTVFLGFTAGTVKGSPPPKARLLEVIGDSISAGYGALGSETHVGWHSTQNGCSYSPDTQAAFQTFGAIAARELGAEVSIVAISGVGVLRDYGGAKCNFLSEYENAAGRSGKTKWSFAPKPDAVLINLGTNDIDNGKGDPGRPFEDAYLQFLEKLRTRYPAAFVFLAIGPMLSNDDLAIMRKHLASIVAARTKAGDTQIASFDFGVQPLGGNGETPTGCDWHPSVTEHVAMADMLKAQLRAKLGW
jgi:lysophospholipase L1-like esterase